MSMTIILSNDLSTYQSARAALIDEERSLRRDFKDRNHASADELEADRIIRALRLEEASTIWSVEHPETPNVFPGMEYLSARHLIVQTKIFKLLLKMPKGALLHSHLDAMVNCSVLLRLALEEPAIHVKVTVPLTNESLSSTFPIFRALPPADYSDEPSLTSPSYVSGKWVKITNARKNFSTSVGGSEGFAKWVVDALTINPNEAYFTHNTVKKIWEKFETTFEVAEGLTMFMPIWTKYIKEFFLSSIEDGISYIETRVNFWEKYLIDAEGDKTVTHRECCIVFDRVVNEVKGEMNRQGRPDAFKGARIIYATMRLITCEELEWYTEDCISLKQEFPHMIAGFDLIGSENDLKPLKYYVEPLLRFKKRVEVLGLELPFILHAAETFGDGSEADNNLYDAILLGTKRIGHGFTMAKHPKLINLCKERGIAIEVCPISNEILRLTSSMCTHPLPALINNGVPVALCSDDPSVFGNMGLSFDFFQVLMASEINGIFTLGMLARDSLEHSTLDDERKADAICAWERQWAQFVASVVDETVFST